MKVIADNRYIFSCTNIHSEKVSNSSECSKMYPEFDIFQGQRRNIQLFTSLSPNVYFPSCEPGDNSLEKDGYKIHNTYLKQAESLEENTKHFTVQ